MYDLIVRRAMSFEPPPLLIERFCAEQETSEQEARRRFDETKRFLSVCASNRARHYCPSQCIDEMWHAFMLHSRSYGKFCALIGGFVHHEPSDGHDRGAYLDTIASLRELFGAANPEYWDEASSDCSGCGNCSSCGP
jgi:hypothetical protein